MILSIRNSFITKGFSISMIFVMFFTMIAPINSFGLTGGPAQPEFNAFTPIGTSDMVNLSSGDFNYNIPIMDIGGFPINLAYSSGVTMDQEASWVGLGWDLSIGQINRQMRGLPDDFQGDVMTYENDMKDNFTVGGSFNFTPAITGVETKDNDQDDELGNLSYGVSIQYNNHTGFSLRPSLGVSWDVTKNVSLGLNVESGPDGMSLTPSGSFGPNKKNKDINTKLGGKIGATFNSRQGLTNVNMSASHAGKNNGNYKTGHGLGTGIGRQSIGSSVSYLPNHYTPQVQDNLLTDNFTFNAALGTEFFGSEGQGQIRAFSSRQYIPDHMTKRYEKSYGYDNNHLANTKSVRDFNREKDGNFSVNSTNLPITNYTYDIYSVQGQGVGGMFRPFRSQIGYVNDQTASTNTNGGSYGYENGLGNMNHTGIDIEVTNVNATAGLWSEENGNNAISHFESSPSADKTYEEVYYKNVGDLSSDGHLQSSNYLDYDPYRLKIGGSEYERELDAEYVRKNSALSTINLSADDGFKRNVRQKRNQTILKVRQDEVILEDSPVKRLLGFTENTYGKGHHTAGFIVTRNDGARYVYGQSLYNIEKQEVAFSMAGETGDCATGLIEYTPGVDNDIAKNKKGDQYYNSVTTPAYAHTYLLTTLLSSDYSDVDDIEGPSDGDLGSYTKFEYTDGGDYQWRVPFEANTANHNEGLKSDEEDDRGSYVYGVKETKYISKIETKTHIAIFTLADRHDGFGVTGPDGGLGNNSKMQALEKIELYSKGEYYDEDGNVVSDPIPIKTVHFEYSYELCGNVPNNDKGVEMVDGVDVNANYGKLTLKKVYFTYRNSNMGKYAPYEFTYGDIDHDGTITATENPSYNMKAYNIWGGYKPFASGATNCEVVGEPTVPEYNYVEQDDDHLTDYAAAWSITDIELPSGGKIQITYESDDYAFVQDKKAMQMFKVVGAGTEYDPVTPNNFFPNDPNKAKLFDISSNEVEAEFLYIKLAEIDQNQNITSAEFYEHYVSPIVENYKGLVQFRFFVNMSRKGGKNTVNTNDLNKASFDYINGYFKLGTVMSDYHIFEYNGVKYASVPMQLVDLEGTFGQTQTTVNPISKAGWQFGRKFLSREIYELGGVDESLDAPMMMEAIFQVFQNVKEIFAGPNGLLRGKKIARRFIPQKSWIRLMDPTGLKKGGGCRVARIEMSDEWGQMTSAENPTDHGTDINGTLAPSDRTQHYGQEYSYTTADESGNEISSGVATYEPLGAMDNPFIQPVFVTIERVLGPDDENYMETPFGASFFPSPTVTYSKVTVKNLERDDQDIDGDGIIDVVKKHATGHVTTEFYTSKDFPTLYDQTDLDIIEDGGKKKDQILKNLLNINVKKHLTLSQGYTVHTNDMNGKMKKQLVFGEGQNNPISGALYVYNGMAVTGASDVELTTTNTGDLDNRVDVMDPFGSISTKTIGVEVDVINDFREMETKTVVAGTNFNTANFFAGINVLIPMPLPKYASNEDKLSMAVTTKVINTFGIQTEVIAFDAGAMVSTENKLWDAETGEVILTETVNEYGDNYYSFNYPAHWYYSSMGLASKNSGVYAEIESGNGSGMHQLVPTINNNEKALFHEGDEILVYNHDGTGNNAIYWVNSVTTTELELIDEHGEHFNGGADSYQVKVMRSGYRNLAATSMGSVVLQADPVKMIKFGLSGVPTSTPYVVNSAFLKFVEGDALLYRIINAGAVEFSDDWDEECRSAAEIAAHPKVNLYRSNERGVWRAKQSHLYLSPRVHNRNALGTYPSTGDDQVDPRNDGFYTHFSPFYQFGNPLLGTGWQISNHGWTSTSVVTKYSPYGFELENKDALERYSSAQYGYNYMFPMAVSANARYVQMGFDGFEDYDFEGAEKAHFGFKNNIPASAGEKTEQKSHTGKSSLKVFAGKEIRRAFIIENSSCNP